MNIEYLEKLLVKARNSPVKTTLLITILSIGLVGASWFNSYFSEIAKIAAGSFGEGIRIVNVTVGTTEKFSQIDVVIRNSFKSEILLNRVAFDALIDRNFACCCPPTEAIELSEEVRVVESLGVWAAIGRFHKLSDEGVFYRLKAKVVDNNCSHVDFSAQMDTSISIKGSSLFTIHLLVPKQLKITSYEVKWGESPTIEPEKWSTDLSDYDSINLYISSSEGLSSNYIYKADVKPFDIRKIVPTG